MYLFDFRFRIVYIFDIVFFFNTRTLFIHYIKYVVV